MDIQFFYTNTLGLTDEELIKTLAVNSNINFVKKETIIQNIGDINKELRFLCSGIFRGYFLDIKGREITDCFGSITGTPITSCLDLDVPSPICIQALEDCTTISIPLSVLLPLISNDLEIINLYNRLLKDSLKIHWGNKIALVQYSATERYQWFLKTYPDLINRVNHRYIASFLGMTPVSLSRIRRSIRQNNTVSNEILQI